MTPSNLAVVGLATGLLGQIGQAAAQSAKTFTDTALAPFAALFTQETSTTSESSGEVSEGDPETINAFGNLYRTFEEQLQDIFSNYPDLPRLRVQISQDATIRLSAAEESELTPEVEKLITELEVALNRDHQISEMANQLYETKSLDHWRRGATGPAADVEMIVNG